MNILFCSEGFREAREALSAKVPEHDIHTCSAEELPDALTRIRPEVLIPCVTPISADDLITGSVRLVHQFGVGLEGVDVGAATEAGVWVANVPAADTGNADSVAEHALMLMLALSRRLPQMRGDMAARRVAEPAGRALFGKTACLIGLGDIGLEIARRLRPFRMQVVAVRRRPEMIVPEDAGIAQVYGLPELKQALAQSDYVILCAPYSPDFHHMINRESLSWMRPNSYLINVARGGLVDHGALQEALEEGHLAGAGLDVFWEEPVNPEHPLFALNVIATPHVAGITDTACAGIAEAVSENIRRVRSGKIPLNAVNRPAYPRRSDADRLKAILDATERGLVVRKS